MQRCEKILSIFHKHSDLGPYPFLNPHFLCFRSPGRAQLGPLLSFTGLQSIPAGLQFHLQFQLGTGCRQKLLPCGCRICPWPLASSKSATKRTSASSVPPPSESLKIKGFSPNRNYLPFD